MDPNETLRLFFCRVDEGDRYEANEFYTALRGWLDRGGFEPQWSTEERAAFFRYNPLSGKIEGSNMHIHSTLQVCTDCLMFIANGDEPENPPCTCGQPWQAHRTTYHGAEVCDGSEECKGYIEGELGARIADYIGAESAAHLVPGNAENDNEFSTARCGTCGNKYHGARHEVIALCNHEECKSTENEAPAQSLHATAIIASRVEPPKGSN